jgi:hypothetical protein
MITVNKEYKFKYVNNEDKYDVAIRKSNGMIGIITTHPIKSKNFYYIKFQKPINIFEFELMFKDIYILNNICSLNRLKKSFLTKIINSIIKEIE